MRSGKRVRVLVYKIRVLNVAILHVLLTELLGLKRRSFFLVLGLSCLFAVLQPDFTLRIFNLLSKQNLSHLLYWNCGLYIDPLALDLMFVANLHNKVYTSNVTKSHEAEPSRTLSPLVLKNYYVINRSKLNEVRSELH